MSQQDVSSVGYSGGYSNLYHTNITLFVGNGLNLHLGAKTGVQDFCTFYYDRVKSIGDSDAVKKFKLAMKREVKGNTWSELELFLGDYSQGIVLLSDYISCLCDITVKLSEYLTRQEGRFALAEDKYPRLKEFGDQLDRVIASYLDQRFGGRILLNTHVIDFNYTHFLETILKNTNVLENRLQFGEHIYIHGKVGDAMIMGVDNLTQIKRTSIFRSDDDAIDFIKPLCGQHVYRDRVQRAHEILGASDLIVVYGMSMGETDTHWWREIYHILAGKPELQLLIYWHDSEKHNRAFPRYSRMITKEVLERFLSYVNRKIGDDIALEARIKIEINTSTFAPLENLYQEGAPVYERKPLRSLLSDEPTTTLRSKLGTSSGEDLDVRENTTKSTLRSRFPDIE